MWRMAEDGRIVTSSRDVATYFEKQHRNVLRDIDVLAGQSPSAALNFELSNYVDSTGRTLRCFDMTRDGFMLLAMGFTGAKALALKFAYTERFNKMEAALLVQRPARIEQAPGGLPNFGETIAAIAGGRRTIRDRNRNP